MNDAQIKHMGEQFLRWQLPENFNPDGGISFEPIGNKGNSTYEFKRRPSGTNLLDYTQAEAMVRHMLDGLPAKAETTMTSNLDPAALEALVREAIEPLNDTLSSSDYSFLFDNVKDAIVKGLDTLSHAGEGEPVRYAEALARAKDAAYALPSGRHPLFPDQSATFLALSERIREPAKIKALVWLGGATTPITFFAESALGQYRIEHYSGGWFWSFKHGGTERHETLNAAKAAAQADYEQRVFSALVRSGS